MSRESDIEETAARMLARYSSYRRAADMADMHACDSRDPEYWRAVARAIERLAKKGK